MAAFDKLRRYLKVPTRSAARIQRDVDDELQHQIDMRAEALERDGLSPAEARAEAMRRFGSVDETARYCTAVDQEAERRRRAAGWLDELRQDVGHTFRTLERGPAFAVATVLTLAVAVGVSTTIYGVLHTYLVRALPFPHADRLVAINDSPTLDRFPRTPSLRDVDWTPVESLFVATATWDVDGFTIGGGDYAETVTGAWVSPGYFDALSLRPALGRVFRADEYHEPAPVAIISHGLWVRRFGADPGVIGRTISAHSVDRPNAPPAVTIVGVTPPDFWPIQWREGDLLRPFPPNPSSMPNLAVLGPGASRLDVQHRLNVVVRAQLRGEVDPAWHMSLIPALERHSFRVRPLLRAVFGAALFLLLAACGSVAGALVSRMAARRSELGVRLALGGSRARIVRQLLTESVVLAVLAGTLGVAIAYALIDLAGPLIERQLGTRAPGGAAAFRLTPSLMMLAVAASAIAGVVLGLVPAITFLRMNRVSLASVVLGAGRSGSARGGAARVRRVLIAGQVMVAMVLLFGAGLMFRTVARMAATELGFRTDGVTTAMVTLPQARFADSAARRQGMERIVEHVARADGVRSAATVYPLPFTGSWNFPVLVDGAGRDEESAPRTHVFTVGGAFFETVDVRLREGRRFRPMDDHAAPLVVVVSEALARRIAPNGSAIGRRIRVRVPHVASFDEEDPRPWRTVIGVVTNTKKQFTLETQPDVYVPYAQNPRARQAIIVRTNRDEPSVVDPVRRAVAGVDPELAVSDFASMSEIVASQGGQRRGLTVLLGVFGIFALVLSALALYASLSYIVVQRRSELAVRMAMGANARSILRLVVGEGLGTATVGVVLGVAASLALSRVLRNQVYGVGTTDPATLVTIAFVLAVTAIAACAIPGFRAARTDPGLALRE